MARSPSRPIQRRSRSIVALEVLLAVVAGPQPLGRVQPGLDPLGQLDLLLGVEQGNLADLLKVRPDRVGRRGELGVAARLLQRLGLLVVPLEVDVGGRTGGVRGGRLDQRPALPRPPRPRSRRPVPRGRSPRRRRGPRARCRARPRWPDRPWRRRARPSSRARPWLPRPSGPEPSSPPRAAAGATSAAASSAGGAAAFFTGAAGAAALAVVALEAGVAARAAATLRRELAEPSTTTVTPASTSARRIFLACAGCHLGGLEGLRDLGRRELPAGTLSCEIRASVRERTSAPVWWASVTNDLPEGEVVHGLVPGAATRQNETGRCGWGAAGTRTIPRVGGP